MTKVLVVDDESSIRRFLKVSFESNQFTVREALNGEDALREAVAFRPDVVILDLGLPDRHGIEVLKRLREWSKIPVIVLTVQDSDEEKVAALDAGADDYMTKPFSVPELLARVRVALRHAHPEQSEQPVFKSGVLEIDRAARTVKVEGKAIKLTATEYEIISFLATHAGKVVSHRMILKEIWGPNSVEHNHYLRVYLGQIRKKLKVSPGTPEFFETEAGVGYRLKIQD